MIFEPILDHPKSYVLQLYPVHPSFLWVKIKKIHFNYVVNYELKMGIMLVSGWIIMYFWTDIFVSLHQRTSYKTTPWYSVN